MTSVVVLVLDLDLEGQVLVNNTVNGPNIWASLP